MVAGVVVVMLVQLCCCRCCARNRRFHKISFVPEEMCPITTYINRVRSCCLPWYGLLVNGGRH